MSKDKTTTQNSVTTADPLTLRTEAALRNKAQDLSASPFQAFNGERVADLTPDQLRGIEGVRDASDSGSAAINAGAGAVTDSLGFIPEQINAAQAGPAVQADALQAQTSLAGPTQGFDPTTAAGVSNIFSTNPQMMASARDVTGQSAVGGIDQFQNKFTDQVVDNALADQERQRQVQIAQGQAQATASGAFGGSRHGVRDSLTNEAALREAGRTSGELRSRGFETALSAAQGDANRFLAADQGNQAADVATGVANAQNQTNRLGTEAGLGANVNIFNANAANRAGEFGAGAENNRSLFNSGAENATSAFNANLGTNVNQTNAAATNAGNQFDVGQTNTVGIQNAANGLTANGQQIAAGSALGNLGTQQQNRDLTSADASIKAGGIQQGVNQAKNDFSFQEFQRRQADPFQKLAFEQKFNGTTGQTTNQTNTEKGSALGGILGAAGTIAGGPIGGFIGSQVGSLFGPGQSEFNPAGGIFSNGGRLT